MEAMRTTNRNLRLKNPLNESPFYVLIESHGSNGQHDEAKLQNLLELSEKIIVDGLIAQSSSQVNKFVAWVFLFYLLFCVCFFFFILFSSRSK